MPACKCPACGTFLDAATGICEGTPLPRPGDVTVCIECTAVMIYTTSLGLEAVDDPAAIPGIHPDDLADIRKAQAAIRRVQKEHGR